MKAGLSAMRNKTDRNDARGIAQLVRLGWFRLVHVKSEEAQQIRMLLVNRNLLLGKLQDIENSVRGSLKVFGLKLGHATKHSLEARVRELIEGHPVLTAITEPMLRVRRVLMDEFVSLDRMARKLARKDPVCRRLMTVPGVGVIVALTYRTGVDIPERFTRSRDVGAHFGLTPRRYSSGQVDYDGHPRWAHRPLSGSTCPTASRAMVRLAWLGNAIAKRSGVKLAKVALARKLAVVLHRMWVDGTDFRWTTREQAHALAA